MLEYEIQNLENLGIRELAIMNIEQQDEITRLNNIIDELEMYLKRQIEENYYGTLKTIHYRKVLTELYKLKEGKE